MRHALVLMLPLLLAPLTLAPPPSARATATNLLVNPGFELDADLNGVPDGWSPGPGGSLARVAVAVHDGDHSTAYVRGNGPLAATPIAVSPGQRYEVGGWLHGPDAMALAVHFQGPAAPANLTLTWPAGTGWREVSFEVVVPHGASSLTLAVAPLVARSAILDDMRVIQLPDLGERVMNGRFLIGRSVLPDGWNATCTGGAASWTSSVGGDRHLAHAATLGHACITHATSYPATQGGRKYNLTFDHHRANDAVVDLRFYGPSPAYLAQHDVSLPGAGAAWATSSTEWCAPTGTTHAWIRIYSHGPGTTLWDNVSLRDVGSCP